ncbi:MAG: DMT family transporter [Chloroflexi bacterium]|nr:DMT family transporter [Chloroflexota bacterium]
MLTGQISALAGAIGWAASGVAVKPASATVRAVQISAVYSWVAFALVLPLVLVAGRFDDLAGIPGHSMGWLIGASALYTVSDLAFLRLIATGAVGWTFVTTTSLFILFSLVAGLIFLGDEVSWATAAGAAVIVAGLYLVNRRGPAKAPDGVAAGGSRIVIRSSISAGIALFWTGGLLASDLGVEEADPLAAAVLVSLIPAAVYALVAIGSSAVRLQGVARRDLLRVLLSGVFFASSVVAWIYAVKFETAGITAVLTSSSPLFAVLFAFLFLRERISVAAGVGIVLCGAGVVAVILG